MVRQSLPCLSCMNFCYDYLCRFHVTNLFVPGYIVDCAFTVAFNPMYDPLLQATRDATNTGIKVISTCSFAPTVGCASKSIEWGIRVHDFS